MPIKIPASYLPLVQEMARGTGLPISVINAQVMEESGYNRTAVSPAGALGWLQFIPSTYAEYGGKPGTEFNPAAEAKVYIRFINALEQMFHHNLRDVLAAYNAGPGNIGAGMGYASAILGNSSSLAGALINPPPMDAHQLHLNHLAQTAAAGRTPMNRPRLGSPGAGIVQQAGNRPQLRGQGAVYAGQNVVPNTRTVRPTRGITGIVPLPSAHQQHLEHLAHLAATHQNQHLPARTQLQGGKTPPPTNAGTGGIRRTRA